MLAPSCDRQLTRRD